VRVSTSEITLVGFAVVVVEGFADGENGEIEYNGKPEGE